MSASTAGWIAVAAAVLALLGIGAWVWTLVLLRRARAAQKVLLGGGKRDIVDFAVSLQGASTTCCARSTRSPPGCPASTGASTAPSLERRSCATTRSRTRAATSRRPSRCSTRRAPASSSRAIQGRDYARIYVKEIDQGRAPVALSPEEREAVERAMAR